VGYHVTSLSPCYASCKICQSRFSPEFLLRVVEDDTNFAVIVDPNDDCSRLLGDMLSVVPRLEIITQDELKLPRRSNTALTRSRGLPGGPCTTVKTNRGALPGVACAPSGFRRRHL
jgi:hypothetical protein